MPVDQALPACTVENGFVVAPSSSATSYAWRLTRVPQGSQATLRGANQRRAEVFTDVFGYYALGVTQTSAGGTTEHACSIRFFPVEQLAVMLLWDGPEADMDLHLVRESGGMFDRASPDDCYYANCKRSAASPILWDTSSAAREGGNPSLLLDDTNGYGPEIIVIPSPLPGTYRATVQHFSDDGLGPLSATVQVYAHGQLRAQVRIDSLATTEWWDALDIVWPVQGDVCIQTLPAVGMPLCSPVPACSDGSCAQCGPSLVACGPGTACNTGLALCLPSTDACDSDMDCVPSNGRARVCNELSQSCLVPECVVDTDCTAADMRLRCSPDTNTCFLPPADCSMDTTEPDDSIATARPLDGSAATNFTGMGMLCRGNVDYLTFPSPGGKRAIVDVTFTGGSASQATVALYVPGSMEPVRVERPGFDAAVHFIAPLAQPGPAYLVIDGADVTSADRYGYSVTVRVQDPPACETEAGEPDAQISMAVPLTPAQQASRALCSMEDVDTFRYAIPAQTRATFTVTFDNPSVEVELSQLNAAGMQVTGRTLLASPGTLLVSSTTATTVYVSLQLSPFAPVDDPVNYTLRVAEAPMPSCSEDAATEPNDTTMAAPRIVAGMMTGISCTHDDVDVYRIVLGALGDVRLSLAMEAGADLDLRLLSADGMELDASAGTLNPETITAPQLPAGEYFIVVEPYSFNAAVYPVRYTLDVTAPTAM